MKRRREANKPTSKRQVEKKKEALLEARQARATDLAQPVVDLEKPAEIAKPFKVHALPDFEAMAKADADRAEAEDEEAFLGLVLKLIENSEI